MVRSRNDEQVGARAIEQRQDKKPWLALLALLLLLLGALAAWFLFMNDDDDDDLDVVDQVTEPRAANPPASAGNPPASAPSTPTSQGTAGGIAAPAAGEIIAGGQRVLPGGEGNLGRFIGQSAQGRSVRVTSVPSDEAFWVGTSSTNRVFVHLALSGGESPFDIKAGEMVTFSGTMKALPPNPGNRFGLTVPEGLNDLQAQGGYIEATKVAKG